MLFKPFIGNSIMRRMNTFHTFVFSFLALVFFFTPSYTKAEDRINYVIGAILDESSRIGKEQTVAMEIAVEDCNKSTNGSSILLHIRDTQKDPTRAVLEAQDLITTKQIQAILGPQTWEETALVAKISSQNQVPILSLADTIPRWASQRWPFLIQASPDKNLQMKAIAEIVQSWDWHYVTLIHEDMDPSAGGLMVQLLNELREVGAEIRQVIALPPFVSSSTLSKELKKLKKEECRVFVVHLSLPLATVLFEMAKNMEMMEKNYVWITTDLTTSLVHSLNASTISSMQGVIGLMNYFSETGGRFQDFNQRFRRKFRMKYPEEEKSEPGIFAVQAYDALQVITLSLDGGNIEKQELLERILASDIDGLTGKVQFINSSMAMVERFQVINVVGRSSYKELGFWSNGLGFSKTLENATYDSSMKAFGVNWPGDYPGYTPSGWTVPESSKPLRIGVPAKSGYKEFVNVEYDQLGGSVASVTGFSIDVFNAILEELPFYLSYEFIPFENDSYEELVRQIQLKNFDAVVGDVAIISRRYDFADFSHPYTDTGLVMIVPAKAKTSNRAWLFMKPFTTDMWVILFATTIYNGFVVWLIERNDSSEPTKGSILNQIGILLSLAFTTLFSLQGEKLNSNLSRMSMVVWLFVALIITQTYTANLSSMLTVERLEPTVTDVDTLKKNNATVGTCSRSFMREFLWASVDYPLNNIKSYAAPEEYADAFKKKEIVAAFMEVPLAKLFLAKYCKDNFVQAGPTYKVGGFGFAFSRGSPLLRSINKALLNVSEKGKLLDLEDAMMAKHACPDTEKELDQEAPSLSSHSFMVLFIFTGGTSTLALVIYIFRRGTCALGKTRELMFIVLKRWSCKMRFTRRVYHVESPSSSPPNDPNHRGLV